MHEYNRHMYDIHLESKLSLNRRERMNIHLAIHPIRYSNNSLFYLRLFITILPNVLYTNRVSFSYIIQHPYKAIRKTSLIDFFRKWI